MTENKYACPVYMTESSRLVEGCGTDNAEYISRAAHPTGASPSRLRRTHPVSVQEYTGS